MALLEPSPPASPEPHALDGYAIEMLIDRVRIELRFASKTQFQVVRRNLPEHWVATYVEPVNPGAGNVTDTFQFWVQDPQSPARLTADLTALASRMPLAHPVRQTRIVGIEVALDLYPIPGEACRPMEDVALHLITHLARPPEGPIKATWRDVWPSGKVIGRSEAYPKRAPALGYLGAGYSLQLAPDVPSEFLPELVDLVRAYVKTSDAVPGGLRRSLDVAEHRARLERRLQHDLAPFKTISEWETYDFTSLSRLFALRRLESRPQRDLLIAGGFLMQSGRPVDEAARSAHKRTTTAGTRADAIAANRVRCALRRLNTAQRKGLRSHHGSEAARSLVGNLDDFSSAADAVSLGTDASLTSSPKKLCRKKI